MKALFIAIQVLLGAAGLVLLFFWIRVWIKASKAYFQTSSMTDYHEQLGTSNVYKRFTIIFLGLMVYAGIWLIVIFLRNRYCPELNE